ncbi:MAG: potassium channel protein [Calditrichaeota bacterium]|nr:potassium channel protein [Calditrichota bacterium]
MEYLYEKTIQQIRFAVFLLLVIIGVGTLGYMLLEHWSLLDSFYMTIITISTTGFMEVKPLTPAGRLFTTLLIIAGVATIAYTGGRIVQFIIETQIFRRRRMSKKLDEVKNHFIVCGYGRMGKHVCEELKNAGQEFVIIEKDPQQIEQIIEEGFLFVAGDATQDEILLKARIERARGLVAVLSTDAENVFITLSAKVLNPNIFIVARAVEEETATKLQRAGADRVVKPYEIGGTRIAQVLLRPGVVDFIDLVTRERGVDLNFEEIQVQPHSPLIGKTLLETPLRKELNIIVIAIFRKDGTFIYNPTSSTVVQEGDRLIAIGSAKALQQLNNLCLVEDLSAATR